MLLLVANFAFPAVQYASWTETRKVGQLVRATSTVRTSFAMPIWTALERQRANTGNMISDTTILWSVTVVRGLAVAGLVAYWLRQPPQRVG